MTKHLLRSTGKVTPEVTISDDSNPSPIRSEDTHLSFGSEEAPEQTRLFKRTCIMKRPFSEAGSPWQPLEHPASSLPPSAPPSQFIPSSTRPSVAVTSIDQEEVRINAQTFMVRANGSHVNVQ